MYTDLHTLALLNLGLAIYYISKALISPQRFYQQVQCCDMLLHLFMVL